jgi:hypothetical protein
MKNSLALESVGASGYRAKIQRRKQHDWLPDCLFQAVAKLCLILSFDTVFLILPILFLFRHRLSNQFSQKLSKHADYCRSYRLRG